MGGIKCVTPKSEQDENIIIRCLHKGPGPAALGRFGDVPHHHYTHDPKSGLALIDAKVMSKHLPLGSQLRSIVRLDYLWLASFALGITPAPGWSGFNQLVTESQSQSNVFNVFNVSDVVALPFINISPSDMSTNTALIFAHKESSLFNRS